MNARALAVWCLAALTITLASTNPVYRALVVIAALNVLIALGRPGARLRRLVLGVTFAGLFATALTFAVSHSGAHPLFTLPQAVPVLAGAFTLESLVFGAVSGLGIAAAVLSVAPISIVAQPHDLLDALPRALARTGAVVATAVNLIPAIGRGATEIREAQRLRGLHATRLGALSGIAVPVVLTAVEDSVRVAEAMESRAYGSVSRTHYAQLRWTIGDVVLAATAAAAAAVFVALRASGVIADWYPYPDLTAPTVSAAGVATCLALAAPALVRR